MAVRLLRRCCNTRMKVVRTHSLKIMMMMMMIQVRRQCLKILVITGAALVYNEFLVYYLVLLSCGYPANPSTDHQVMIMMMMMMMMMKMRRRRIMMMMAGAGDDTGGHSPPRRQTRPLGRQTQAGESICLYRFCTPVNLYCTVHLCCTLKILSLLRREWQMYRAFQTAQTLFAPRHVFFLGIEDETIVNYGL